MTDRRSRIVSNVVFLGVHAVNVVCTLFALRDGQECLKDKRVADMKQQTFFFLTIWNVIYHLIYLTANIVCELQELYQINDRGLLDPIKAIKQVFFDSYVVPTTISIFIVFWPMFIYDRELLYPQYVDDAIGAIANYMMHAFILLVVVWEMRYMAPTEKHKTVSLANLSVTGIGYMLVLHCNYFKTGMFPYPILHSVYGTVYYPVLLVTCLFILYATYRVQWPLRRLVSAHQKKTKKSNKSK